MNESLATPVAAKSWLEPLRGKAKIYLIVALLVTAITYWPSLKNGFVNNDDTTHLTENTTLRALDFPHLKAMFTSSVNPTYIPLTTLSFAVEYHFFKYNPLVYHVDNLLLHLLVTTLLFYFALQIGLSPLAAFSAALLFGIHPLHVESVAWITGRKDVLYSLFYLLALCFYWEYLSSRKASHYVPSVIFGLLSILAKAMALSLPLVLWLCDWYKGRAKNKSMLLDKIPYALTIIPVALVTYFMNARNPVQHAGEALYFWTWCFIFYLKKFIVPTDIIIFNKFPLPYSLSNPEFSLSLLAFVAVLALLWIFRKNKLFMFAVVFYFFSIFFLLRFDNIKYLPPVSSRYMYLPSLGLCYLLGYGIDRFFVKTEQQKILRAIGTVIIILLMCLFVKMSATQIRTVWNNSIQHWSHELKYDPDNAMALVNRGESYKDIGKFDLAFADFNRAVTKDPEYPEGFNSRGQMLGMAGKLDEALKDFERTIQLKPNFDEAYNNIGVVLGMKGDTKKATAYFEEAVELDPTNTAAHYNLGDSYYREQKFDKAFVHFQHVLALEPRSAPAYNKRGLILAINGKLDAALRDFNRAAALDPNNPEVFKNRGVVLEHRKMYKDAIENYTRAIRLNPQFADAYFSRGNVYAQTKRYGDAAQDFQKALQIDPKHEGAKRSQQLLIKILTEKDQQKPAEKKATVKPTK